MSNQSESSPAISIQVKPEPMQSSGLSVDSLLMEIAERGWMVNNLFQRDDSTWQANLRTSTHFTHFGVGTTALEALAEAIAVMDDAQLLPKKESVAWSTVSGSMEESRTTARGQSLLAALGLARKPINRRI
jgi:hypothetical protein